MSRPVAVVAHTHWDREWYAPFEYFRARLGELVDTLLAELDDNPGFRRFLLDGQMAVVDDYLSVRPDAANTIRRLNTSGRLAMGPWYVLMDEFCVSGETMVRNLQLGLARAAAFGGAMPVGYLPDMFGHVGQMPQLLLQAGLAHAVVWRGVPASVTCTGFWWAAPDGSRVRAEYLPVGYANGAYLPGDAADLVRRVQAHEAEVRAFLAGESAPLLLMNGTDHQPPQPELPGLLEAANRAQDHFQFHQTSLPEYLEVAPIEGLPCWQGELRSGARANILMGVLSNRVDVKVAAARVERQVERVAEPLATLWLPAGQWPGPELDEAWLAMIHNAAHDSICACSADSVGRAVLHRYDRAATLAEEVTNRALEVAGLAFASGGPVVLNPGPADTAGVVEAVLPGDTPITGTQVLDRVPAGVEERRGVGADLGRLLAELTADGWLYEGRGVDAQVVYQDGVVRVTVEADAARAPEPNLPEVRAEAWAQAGAHRDEPLTVRVERRASQRVAARVSGVPGYGWAAFQPDPDRSQAVRAGATWLDNSVSRVEVDPETGTFALDGLPGFDRLVDGGDAGDTYTYSPPACDSEVDRPDAVTVELVEPGPVRGRLRVRRRYRWPREIRAGRRSGQETVEVVTELELRAGEALARVATSFDNPCRDHRLRAWFPLPETAQQAVAECAFATVARGPAEGGPHERPLATYPARRFVTAGGLTVTHEGLLEYELEKGGAALALTLLRSTGMLSQPAPSFRPNTAGPALPLDGPQLIGPHRVRYAISVATADPWRLADLAWLPLTVLYASGGGSLAASGRRLTVRGAEVSALHRVEGTIEVRVFNPSEQTATVEVPGHAGWLVDLRGRPVERWAGRFRLRPWGIATARLDTGSLDDEPAPTDGQSPDATRGRH
jgi:alpha-mannosidase